MYEKHGTSRSIRKYVDLPDDLPYGGEHWHGDFEDFMGESLAAKYSYGIGDGAEFPCMGRGTKHIGIAFGVTGTLPEPDKGKIGLALGLVGANIPPEKSRIGLKLAVKGYPYYNNPKIGLALAVKGKVAPPEFPIGKVGLALTVKGVNAPPEPPIGKIGLALAVKGINWAPTYEKGEIGLALAVSGLTENERPKKGKIGLALAVSGDSVLPPPPVGKIGLYLAVNGVASGGGVGDPGTDCASALLVDIGTWGPFTIDHDADEQWFKWIIYTIPYWHITVTVTGGDGAIFKVWYGIDCFHLFLLGEGTTTFCLEPGFSDTGYNWLEVIAPVGAGSVTYTFELGAGGCP